MADYSQMKVPDLKKILQERGLVVSGNKADLIARLQEDDKKAGGAAAGAGEDEIDWDEDDNKATAPATATTEPAAAAVAAGGQGPVDTPIAVPNQKVDVDPSTTTDLKVSGGEDAPTATDGAVASAGTTTTEPAPAPVEEAPKQDFSIGLEKSDAQKEAEKRAARAKRFNIPENEEAKKLAERAKKFGLDGKDTVISGLDSALPERRQKRAREEKNGGNGGGGRAAKRQTPDRRSDPKPKGSAPSSKKESFGKITDDPVEKAKAEARAKRFGKPAVEATPAATATTTS
ncbi:uncharacterized protein LY89DRAFT_681904 [Mollisia scopiformis]|uniref:SAP domain-containing protein n=1 Tax=Mollisia scopiformis TaxID=149040 RepID=A0A194XMN8_MOLSC|nr:uncharacterized protein LY89DRAFT_681904 [Mollisia scopiformis]KUJ21396.1 hypothetical protein LY89DRAFT_681904 [Mollisia scopiformis]